MFNQYPFRLVLLGLGLIGVTGLSITSVFACSINQSQGIQKADISVQDSGNMQPKAFSPSVLQEVTLNSSSPSDYLVSDIEGLELNVQAAINNSKSTGNTLFVPIKVNYILTNRRNARIAILNKLPPISFGELGSFSPFYPVVLQDDSDQKNFTSTLRGWSTATRDTHASIRMFFGRPPGDAAPTQIEYLVIPGRTTISSNESFNESTTAYIANNSSALENLKTEGLNFCVQVVMDDQMIDALPNNALVSRLQPSLPSLNPREYANPSDSSLPKLPNSQLLCKNAAVNYRS